MDKTYRVVSSAVHFGGDDAPDEIDGVVNNSVNLGTAAECVRILNPVAETMTL